MHTAPCLTLTAQPNEPKTRFATNGSSSQRFGEQNNYTWLRSLTGKHVDFWQLTSEALAVSKNSLNEIN
jgi:hypothetical protein